MAEDVDARGLPKEKFARVRPRVEKWSINSLDHVDVTSSAMTDDGKGMAVMSQALSIYGGKPDVVSMVAGSCLAEALSVRKELTDGGSLLEAFREAARNMEVQVPGQRAAVAGVKIDAETGKMCAIGVGDIRVMVLTKDGKLERVINESIASLPKSEPEKTRLLDELDSFVHVAELSKEAASVRNSSHSITTTLGGRNAEEPQTVVNKQLSPGDTALILSRVIYKNLTTEETERIAVDAIRNGKNVASALAVAAHERSKQSLRMYKAFGVEPHERATVDDCRVQAIRVEEAQAEQLAKSGNGSPVEKAEGGGGRISSVQVEKKPIELRPNEPRNVPYVPGKLIGIILARGAQVLEVGQPAVFGFRPGDMDYNFPVIVVSRPDLDKVGRRGFKSLRVGESYDFGRYDESGIVYSRYVSRKQIRVSYDGKTLSFMDLGSSSGTSIDEDWGKKE